MTTEEDLLHSYSPSKPFSQGLVQFFAGDGKGKTSASVGVALRALGHRLRLYITCFMKSDYPCSNAISWFNYLTHCS